MADAQGEGVWETAALPTHWTWGECPHFAVTIHRRLGGNEIFMWQTVAKMTLTCSVLSSVPIGCLTKAYLASGLHMLLSWYSGSFQYYCIQDTAIVSDRFACFGWWASHRKEGWQSSALKASQLLCPSARGVFHPTVGEYFSLIWTPPRTEVRVVWFFSTCQPCKVVAVLPRVWGHKSLFTDGTDFKRLYFRGCLLCQI